MNSAVSNAFIFLIQTSFDLYFIIVLLRLLFQYFRVDFYNPFSQFILKVTNPILMPLQRIIPKSRKIDLSTLLLLIAIKALELFLISLLSIGTIPSIGGLILWPIGEILSQTINVFCLAILMTVILSWVAPKNHTPISSLLIQITEPLLSPARKLMPATIGIDFSPLLVLIALKFLDILLIAPITQLGKTLAY